MDGPISERSFAPLTPDDLDRIRRIAEERLERVFAGGTARVAAAYRDRLALLALAQGAAQHVVDGRHGVKDIDVWAFFRGGLDAPFPPRARWRADFGPSVHGRHPDDVGFAGRRIDVLGRSLRMSGDDDPVEALKAWLRGPSASAQALSRRPLVILSPERLFATIIPPLQRRRTTLDDREEH